MQQGRVQLDTDWNEETKVQMGGELIYLQVWERDVQQLDDATITNPADGSPNTTVRDTGLPGNRPLFCLVRQVGRERTSSKVEVALGIVERDADVSFTLPQVEIMVGGSRWEPVSSFSASGPGDRVYVVSEVDGNTVIEFGDGKNGARPPTGAEVIASYSFERGSSS